MNIFAVDRDPVIAAQSLVDRHVVKMVIESAQILSTVHRVIDGVLVVGPKVRKHWELPDIRDAWLYKSTHVNHPCTIWARERSENYRWLFDHYHALGEEYTHRYGKVHKSMHLVPWLAYPPKNVPYGGPTEFPNAMPKELIISVDSVENYRNYYKIGKAHLHKWTNRAVPTWI